MKKFNSLLFIILLFLCGRAFAQGADTLLFENFEEDSVNIPITFPTGNDTTWIDYDGDGYDDASGTGRPPEWFLTFGFADADSSDIVLSSNSWTSPNDPVANYLILPPLTISDTVAKLSWKSAPFQTPRYVDGYYVVVSTSCNYEDCFTDTLFRAAEYISVGSLPTDSGFSHYTFSPGFVHGEDGTYIEYHNDSARFNGVLRPFTASLAKYAGQTIYIAFVHGSKDDNLISIDDILVTGDRVTGISEIKDAGKAEIFPNPAHDLAMIRFSLPVTSEVIAEVYDLGGKLVKSVSAGMMVKGDQQIQLHVNDLARGNYNLVINYSGRKIISKLTVQ